MNTVAAAAVTAVLNTAGEIEVPFIFEGDGSAFCVPPGLLEDVRAALAKTRDMARASFGLDLRVATVPVARVREAGFDILVARYRVSENYVQAVFAGGGMAWVERYMKDPATAGAVRGRRRAARQPRRTGVPLAGHSQPARRDGEPDRARRPRRCDASTAS